MHILIYKFLCISFKYLIYYVRCAFTGNKINAICLKIGLIVTRSNNKYFASHNSETLHMEN